MVFYGCFANVGKPPIKPRAVSAASRGLCLQDPSPVGRPLGVFEFLSRLDICFQQQAVATWGNFYGDQQLDFVVVGGVYFLVVKKKGTFCNCMFVYCTWMYFVN